MFRIEEVNERLVVPHRFGVVMPYSEAQATFSGLHLKQDFMKNKLVIARCAGSLGELGTFYDKSALSDGVGNYQPLAGKDPSISQGRVLFVYYDYDGLSGNSNLYSYSRFVGVAPKAP